MNPLKLPVIVIAAIFLVADTSATDDDEIHIAVATNFSGVLKEIASSFGSRYHQTTTISSGSTGKLYSQIKNGAPFELFFAADSERPGLLEKDGTALPGTRCTYAIGKVGLWSARSDFVDSSGLVLSKGGFKHLAIANPKLAPFGKAAYEVLTNLKLWNGLQEKIVRGEDIGQTLHFVTTGAAELGFVSESQIRRPGSPFPLSGSYWEVPSSLYSPIIQQAVLLKENKAARDFLAFVKSVEAGRIIRSYGYATP